MHNPRKSSVSIMFVLLAAALAIPTQFVYATSIGPPCQRFNYTESYVLDPITLPPLVALREEVSPGGIYKWYFLDNTSSKPLIVQYKDSYQTQVKLVDSKVYNKSSDATDWSSSSKYANWNSLYNLVRIDAKIQDPISADVMPAPIAPIYFSLTAQLSGQPISITGTLSYILIEHDCATGKVKVVGKTDIQKTDTATTSKSVDTSDQVVQQDVEQEKSFWARILQFLVSLKFW